MSLIVFLTQVLLPIALLAWLARHPTSSLLGYVLHVASTAAIFLSLMFASLWAFPPFWTPWFYGSCLIAIVAWQITTGRTKFLASAAAARVDKAALAALFSLACFCSWFGILAVRGATLPTVAAVNIAPPFGPGLYLVAHGGSTEIINPHMRTLDESMARYLPWRGQSRGLDVFKVTPLGLRVNGWHPVDPARYETFGAPLVAPCGGAVVLMRDGLPDMPVPEMDSVNKLGNFVAIDCGGFVIFLAHLRSGSVLVSSGQLLAVGDPLGEMGNSGNTSEPHLHIHAQRSVPEQAPAGGEPLALKINNRFFVRNDLLRIAEK